MNIATTSNTQKNQQDKMKEGLNTKSLDYLQQGNELVNQGKLDQAIAKYQYSLEMCHDDLYLIELYKNIDTILSKHDKSDELIDIYKQAVQRYPDNHWFYKRLGDTYYKEQKIDSAIMCYQQAIEINNNFAWSYKMLGDAYYMKGYDYFKNAYDNYQQAIKTNSKVNKSIAQKIKKISPIISEFDNNQSHPEDRDNYWNKRKDSLLYRMVKSLAFGYVPNGHSVLEVGCHTSSFIFELDWFEEKLVTDLPFLSDHWKGVEGVQFIPGDFYKLKFDRTFDLVLCTQVVEHLKEPKPFIQKLLLLGKTIIVSTTYEVPKGLCKYHVQDPINMEKFKGWFEKDFTATVIIEKPDQKIWKNIIGVVNQE